MAGREEHDGHISEVTTLTRAELKEHYNSQVREFFSVVSTKGAQHARAILVCLFFKALSSVTLKTPRVSQNPLCRFCPPNEDVCGPLIPCVGRTLSRVKGNELETSTEFH